MTNADLHAELLRLRKQVESLSEARKQQKARAQPEIDGVDTSPESPESDIRKQIEELIKSVQEEIREMPAMPTLGVFLLGVLVGRYLR